MKCNVHMCVRWMGYVGCGEGCVCGGGCGGGGGCVEVCVCDRTGIQSDDENEFNTVKVMTFLQSEARFVAYCNDIYSAYWGIEEYKPYPRFVLHVAHTL